MTIRERLLEISELELDQVLIKMRDNELHAYIKTLNKFIVNFPKREGELKQALEKQDYIAFSRCLVMIKDMLIDINACRLAEECQKQIDKLAQIKHEKIEAYMNYFLSLLAMLSIDIQMAVYKDENEAAGEPPPEAATEQNDGKKSILAVDDNSFFLDTLKTILRGSDYKLTCVTSGMAALRYLQKNRPDLFILDIEMPEMNGYELAGKIRAYGKKAPIIFLTGNATRDYVLKAMNAGAADFIIKPINQKHVLERIDKFI